MPEQLAQGADLDLKVVLFDNKPRPNHIQKFVLRDRAVPALYECEQRVERPAAELERLVVHRQQSLIGHEAERDENVRRGVGHQPDVGDPMQPIVRPRAAPDQCRDAFLSIIKAAANDAFAARSRS